MLHTTENPLWGLETGELVPSIGPEEAQHIYEAAQKESVLVAATGSAAAAVRRRILERYQANPPQTKQEIEEFKVELDDIAVSAMSRDLHEQTLYCLHTVGSEGDKEIQHNGFAAPSLKNGKYGHDQNHRLDKVSDAIEGTSAAAKNKAGAVSVIAVSNEGGLLPSQEGVFYMEKLFGPPELVGHVSLSQTPEEMLETACLVLNISPRKLSVVVLKRDRNQHYIDAAKKLGVDLYEIDAGDFMPSLLAVTRRSSSPFLVVGIGGYEEGVMAAAAAKAVGGLAEARIWQSAEAAANEPILKTDDLVPGNAEDTMVVASAITNDFWFDLDEVEVDESEIDTVTSIRIDSRGVSITRNEIPFRPIYIHE